MRAVNERCEAQQIDVVIDELIYEHIVMFVLQELPPLEIGRRYRVTLEPLPDTVATLPPKGWRDEKA